MENSYREIPVLITPTLSNEESHMDVTIKNNNNEELLVLLSLKFYKTFIENDPI